MSKIKDKKISIIGVTYIEDELGQEIEVTGVIPNGENIWAYYRQASADEFFGAATTNYKVDAVFEINWRDDLHNSMKILFRDSEYNITRIDDFEGNKNDLKIYAYKLN